RRTAIRSILIHPPSAWVLSPHISFFDFENRTHCTPVPTVEISLSHSSYKRGCQEKSLSLSPLETCCLLASSPVPFVEGFLVFAAFDRRVFQRRCQPQLMVSR